MIEYNIMQDASWRLKGAQTYLEIAVFGRRTHAKGIHIGFAQNDGTCIL